VSVAPAPFGPSSAAPPDAYRLFGTAIRTTAASALGQGLAVAVPVAVAWRVGATSSTDSFFLAYAVIAVVVTAATGVGQHSAIPDLIEWRDARGSHPLADQMLAWLVWTSVAASVIAALGLLAWGAGAAVAPAAAFYALLLVPFAALAAACSVAAGVLAADRSYARGAASLMARWGVAVFAVLAFADLGIGVLAAGLALGEALRFVLLRSWLGARGRWSPRVVVPRAASRVLAVLRNSAAQFAGSLVLAATLVVDRLAVAGLGEGSVSLLEYAERVWQVPIGLAMTGVLAVALTEWSHDAVTAGGVARGRVAKAAAFAALATAPVAAAGWVWRGEVTAMLFGGARFSGAELDVLADLIGTFLAITPVYVAGVTYGRALLAERRAHWLLIVAVLQLAIKVVANGPAVAAFGIIGVAMTTAVIYAAALGAFILVPAHRPAPAPAA
jgi:putative peptidoglycan lipid II flippase